MTRTRVTVPVFLAIIALHATPVVWACDAAEEVCERLSELENEQEATRKLQEEQKTMLQFLHKRVYRLEEENQRLMRLLHSSSSGVDPDNRRKRDTQGVMDEIFFEKQPNSKAVTEGKTAILDCITTKTISKCIWRSPANTEVTPTENDSKYQLVSSDDNSCSMRILKAETQDGGSWTCAPQLEDTRDTPEAVGSLTVVSKAVTKKWKKYHRQLQLMDAVLAGYTCKTSQNGGSWRCVKVYKQELTWEKADMSCKDHGSRLVEVVSNEDREEITELLGDVCPQYRDCAAWIGSMKPGQENLSHSECEEYYSEEYLRITAATGEIFCANRNKMYPNVFYICEQAASMREIAYKKWKRTRRDNLKGSKWKGW